ncbi:MAG: nuclear transport factor 2 family protein [Alphaproteobacteria bacterium]
MTGLTLDQLNDRVAISDVLHRYCRAIDIKDWALLETCFTEDLEADFTSFAGRDVVCGRDNWLKAIRLTISGLEATQHLTGNHTIALHGDAASLRADIQAVHILANPRGDGEYTVGGWYDIDLRRTDDGWRIGRYKLTVRWSRGNRDLLRLAAKRADA